MVNRLQSAMRWVHRATTEHETCGVPDPPLSVVILGSKWVGPAHLNGHPSVGGVNFCGDFWDHDERFPMSFSMFARPLPTNRPDPTDLGSMKYAIAREFLDHDGSLRTDPFTVGKELIPFLRGVRAAAARSVAEDADMLIDLIEANPQGVELWIGDWDDA